MLLAFVIVLLTILVTHFLCKYYKLNKQLKGFVSPPGLPILKHFFLFSSKIGVLPNLLDAVRKYGGFLKFELFYGVPTLLTADKDLVGHILNSVLLKDSYYDFCERWVGEGLIICKPSKWKKTRKILNPAFHIQTVESYIETFENSAKILVEKLTNEVGNDGFDVLPRISLCTLDIICETIMGVKLNVQNDEISQYTQDIHEITSIIVRRLFSPFKRNSFLYMFSRDYWKELQVVKRIRNVTQNVLDDKRKIKAETKNNGIYSGGKKHTSLLDTLLEAEYDGRPLTDEELLDEVQTFLFAGHDTSATTVSLCLYCLSKHPDVQDKILEELKDVFGENKRPPRVEDLNEMRYLDMVIKETLRIYTPVPITSRLIDEDVSFGNIFIPKGFTIMLFLHGVHMNKDYHPNPDVFDPSRFGSKVTPQTFLPFGGGPRNCIGQRFGILEVKYLMCQIVRNFKILPVPGHVPKEALEILLRFKNGMMIRLQER